MSQIATTENEKTWLPLLAVQRRSHAIGYHMPVRDHASAADATAAALAARRRLRAGPMAMPSPGKAIATHAPRAAAPEPIEPGAAPLNMLTTCSWRFLVALAALRHGMNTDDVMRRCRQRHIIAARTDAIELIYRHTQYSMPGVGRIFELDHTSILNALIKTGSTDKLVEVLPHMDTARRSKNRSGMVLAVVEPTPIPIPTSRPANAVQRIVRAGYRAGKPRNEIAAEAGIGPASVPVIASRMGLRRSDYETKELAAP